MFKAALTHKQRMCFIHLLSARTAIYRQQFTERSCSSCRQHHDFKKIYLQHLGERDSPSGMEIIVLELLTQQRCETGPADPARDPKGFGYLASSSKQLSLASSDNNVKLPPWRNSSLSSGLYDFIQEQKHQTYTLQINKYKKVGEPSFFPGAFPMKILTK